MGTSYPDTTRLLSCGGDVLGGCPRIDELLRTSGFWPLFLTKIVK